jgi:lipoprotein-releasing system permease protein
VSLDWYLAWRYLTARKQGRLLSFITAISLGGVIVGVMALIVVIAVMSGAQKDFRAAILSSNPHVLILESGSSLRMRNWQAVLDSVRKIDGVSAASPFIFSQVGLLRSGEQYANTAQLVGISMDTTSVGATDLERDIREGVYNLKKTASGLPPALLGSGLADRLLVFPGDTIVVVALENLQQGVLGMSPRTLPFEVTGTFTSGMYETDTGTLYTNLGDAQNLLSLREVDAVSGLGVQTDDPMEADDLARRIQEAVPFPYVSQSWFTTNRALFSALELEKLAMFVILFLIVLVAAFNIVSTLVMVVADRTREIGILKSMGMTDRGILRVFVLQGAWIGIVGTAVGTVLGLLLCWILDTFPIIQIPPDVYFVDRLPVSVELFDVLTIVAASVAVALVATIYPARQAAGLEVVDAIRHE